MMQNDLEHKIGYFFKDKALLNEALSHPSLHSNHKFLGKDYERLEFLGDSVIALVITHILYHKYKNSAEGNLAKMRNYLVSNEAMTRIVDDISLSRYIIMSAGEEHSGGRNNKHNLENVLEAVCGAIYLDGGIESAGIVISNLWKGLLALDIKDYIDPKSQLQEMMQKMELGLPEYSVLEKTGPAHHPSFLIECDAGELGIARIVSNSIKMGQKLGAKQIIDNIENDRKR